MFRESMQADTRTDGVRAPAIAIIGRVTVAYLVISHRNPGQILRLVRALKEGSGAEVVVRHDERCLQLDPAALAEVGARRLTDGIEVEWGQASHLEMLLGALARVREDIDPDWLMVISGQDYPLRPLAEIESRLEEASDDAYLGNPWRLDDTDGEFFRRYGYWHARVPAKTPRPPRRVEGLAYRRDLPASPRPMLGIRRPRLPFGPGYPCWVSSDWPILNRRALDVVLRQDPALMRHYRRCFAASESYFATVLENEPGISVSGDDRRFVRFAPDAPSPDLLTSADLDVLLASGAHFARKFDTAVDAAVLDALDERRRSAEPR
jgi:hypothetical protein